VYKFRREQKVCEASVAWWRVAREGTGARFIYPAFKSHPGRYKEKNNASA
jgi:hypothetical protein